MGSLAMMGIALSGPARLIAILAAGRRVDHLEFFASRHVVSLVSYGIDDGAAGALLGLVDQKLQFQLAAGPLRPLTSELLATVELVLSGIGKDRDRPHRCWRACQ
jgi:hypothetical protein